MDERRVRVLVAGRVQGVFFRDTARRVAERHGLSGWIANRPDGRVEAEFQGSAGAVDDAVAFCRTGPPRAEVTDVEVTDVDPRPDERGFTVR